MKGIKRLCFLLVASILFTASPVRVFAEEHINNEVNAGEYDISVLSSVRLQQSEDYFDQSEADYNYFDDDYDVEPCTPASVNPSSTCVGSVCAGSVCVGSACAGSICVGSACAGSICGGSGCVGSTCGGSACASSGCVGSACVGSVCTRCRK
jgi:hypothetical protein